jgi:hypothetical protein
MDDWKEVKCDESAFYPLFDCKNLSSRILINKSLNFLTEMTGFFHDLNSIISQYAVSRFHIPMGKFLLEEEGGRATMVLLDNVLCMLKNRFQPVATLTTMNLQTGHQRSWEFPGALSMCQDPSNKDTLILLCCLHDSSTASFQFLNVSTGKFYYLIQFMKVTDIYYITASNDFIYILNCILTPLRDYNNRGPYSNLIYALDRKTYVCHIFAGGDYWSVADGPRYRVRVKEASSGLYFMPTKGQIFFTDAQAIRFIDLQTDTITTLSSIEGEIRATCGSSSLLIASPNTTKNGWSIVNVNTKEKIDLDDSLWGCSGPVYDERRNVFYYIMENGLYAMTDIYSSINP